MIGLLAVLWAVYLSDCFGRQRADQWTFRRGAFKPVRGFAEPDILLGGGSVGFVWTPLLPWHTVFCFSGRELGLAAARRRFDQIRQHSRRLNIASLALFAWLMGGVSVLVLTDRLLSVLIPWAAVCVLFSSVTFALFISAYTRTHRTRPPLETWLTLALSPISLIRAPIVVAFSAARDVHPVTAAAVLCRDEEFLRIARLWYFDHPELRAKIVELAGSRRLQALLTAGPETWEPGVSLFCPRCHSTFKRGVSECSDCGDMRLEPLGAAISEDEPHAAR